MIFGPLFMILFLAVLIAVVVLLVRWLGGPLLLLVIVFATGAIFPLAMRDDAARFALCSLAFAVLLSLAHGRVSRDGVLFALLGCAVGVRESFRDPARALSTAAASGASV